MKEMLILIEVDKIKGKLLQLSFFARIIFEYSWYFGFSKTAMTLTPVN